MLKAKKWIPRNEDQMSKLSCYTKWVIVIIMRRVTHIYYKFISYTLKSENCMDWNLSDDGKQFISSAWYLLTRVWYLLRRVSLSSTIEWYWDSRVTGEDESHHLRNICCCPQQIKLIRWPFASHDRSLQAQILKSWIEGERGVFSGSDSKTMTKPQVLIN